MPVVGRRTPVTIGVLAIDHGVMPVVAVSAAGVVTVQPALDRLTHVSARGLDVPPVRCPVALVGDAVALLRAPGDGAVRQVRFAGVGLVGLEPGLPKESRSRPP